MLDFCPFFWVKNLHALEAGPLEPRWDFHPVVPGDGVPREIQGACHCRGADFWGPREVGGMDICYPRNQLQMAASENNEETPRV